ncbi:MAG: NOL1/NOP2/sun family putative RNA methylase, partial [Vicinamibacteria bacterium]
RELRRERGQSLLMKLNVPAPFRDRMARLAPGLDAGILDALGRGAHKAIRVNPLRPADEGALMGPLTEAGVSVEPLQFLPGAYHVLSSPERFRWAQLDAYRLGDFYVESPSSLLPPLELGAEAGEVILDAAAAPGSKATQIGEAMRNEGVVVANDVSSSRLQALAHHLDRLGLLNVVVLRSDARTLGSRFPERFDRVLLDAPCSGEGLLSKGGEIFRDWGVARIHRLAGLQRAMIDSCFDALRPEGVLVYSTCTFAPEENEATIDHLLGREDATLVPIVIAGCRTYPGVTQWNGKAFRPELERSVRIYPGEDSIYDGLFMAKIKKEVHGSLHSDGRA